MNQKHMKNRKNESEGYAELVDGRLKWIPTSSTSKEKPTRTSPMSTHKTTAKFDLYDRLSLISKMERAELLWRYKAQKAIIQNLRAALIAAGLPISDKLMDPTLNTFKYFYVPRKAETTLETGQSRTSAKNYDSEIEIEADARTTTLPPKLR